MREERILLYLKDYLGDAVMTQPLAEFLGLQFADVKVITAPLVRPVLWSSAYEFGFLSPIRARSPWGVVRAARDLRRRRFHAAVLVNRSFRTAIVAKLAGIPKRIGHQSEGRDALLTHRIPYLQDRFEAFCISDLGVPLGLSDTEYLPKLEILDEEATEGRALLQGAEVGLQPGARFPAKQLPMPTMVALARRLQSKGYRLALLGGKEEAEDARALAERLDQPVVDLVGKTSIRGLLGVAQNLRLTLGNDTGVMHLAAGAGCPVIQVFGPTPAQKWGHAYGRNRVVKAPNGSMCLVDPDLLAETALEVLEGA